MKYKKEVTEKSWFRKAIGALKDMTSIGIAKTSNRTVFEDDIDIAVLKATRHNEIPPKEKHVLTALSATGASVYQRRLLFTMGKRLTRSRDWRVAVKTLGLFHRLLREGGPAFAQEVQHFSHRSVIEGIFSFEDRSSPFASDFSLWVRKYSCYLAQRLHCTRIFKYDVALENDSSRIKDLNIEHLLEYLPSLQLLLSCLLDCTAEESCVVMNSLLKYALDLLVKECPNIYATINVCICKLLSSFFDDMPRHKALKLLDIYKQNLRQSQRLSIFYASCKGVLTRGHIDFPSLNNPSDSVLSEMEDCIRKRAVPASGKDWKMAFHSRINPSTITIHHSADIEIEKNLHDGLNDNTVFAGDEITELPSLSFSDWLLPPHDGLNDNTVLAGNETGLPSLSFSD